MLDLESWASGSIPTRDNILSLDFLFSRSKASEANIGIIANVVYLWKPRFSKLKCNQEEFQEDVYHPLVDRGELCVCPGGVCSEGVFRGCVCLGVCVTINSLQEHQKILKDVTLSKVSDFAFIMVVYENFFYYFEVFKRKCGNNNIP